MATSAPEPLRAGVEAPGRLRQPKQVIGGAVILLVAGWLFAKAIGDFGGFLGATLLGLTLAGLYFVVASGFTLIFGLMRTINMAHGSLYLLGGYIAFELQEKLFSDDSGAFELSIGQSSGETQYTVLEWLIPLVIAALAMGVLGVLIYQLLLRWNQGQELRQALITI